MSIEKSPQGPVADPPRRPVSATELKLWLTKEARRLGFDDCRVASAGLDFGDRLDAWLAEGHHAGMGWMATQAGRRRAPKSLWPEARSVIMLAMNYGPDSDPLATLSQPEIGTISVYARGRDYHDIIKGRLKELAQKLASRTGGEVKVFVDTAPLMEKPLAQAAGLGWQGKHTVLLSRGLGNWLFLGAILTTLELDPDPPEQDHCGSCRRCLAACPTDAFPAPYVLDARRCISYLTIEHEGPIDRPLRPLMGNRIFGCDDCLAVCPWNKFAAAAREAKLQARAELAAPPLARLLSLDEAAFRAAFTASPIKRTGRNRFMRNVLIAAGNATASTERAKLAAALTPHLDDPDPVVRGAAVWALARLAPGQARAERAGRLPVESDAGVREEWELAA